MSRRIKENLSFPCLVGGDIYFENVALLHSSKDYVFSPGLDSYAFCLPKAIHDGGSGEVSVAVPSFDDTIGLLFCPHDFCFTVDPLGSRGDGLAIVKIDCTFNRVCVAVGTFAFPFVALVVLIDCVQRF